MHEHIARTMYYVSVHLLFASMVGFAAGVLTTLRGASATTKYWIWVATAINFVVPMGALIDKLWSAHLAFATPLGVMGGPIWDMTQGRTALVLAGIWISGACAMLVRLISRVRREYRETQRSKLTGNSLAAGFVASGITVLFDDTHPSPAVCGVLSPHILLPVGMDRILKPPEFKAVLLHELAHARRRDNLIRLFYEASLCALWFHPVVWLAGARMALYRELSCDESVIRHAHGPALISALAKLAVPEQPAFLHAAATSHLSYRVECLAAAPVAHRAANLLLVALFTGVATACVFGTVAHTACCFVLKH